MCRSKPRWVRPPKAWTSISRSFWLGRTATRRANRRHGSARNGDPEMPDDADEMKPEELARLLRARAAKARDPLTKRKLLRLEKRLGACIDKQRENHRA